MLIDVTGTTNHNSLVPYNDAGFPPEKNPNVLSTSMNPNTESFLLDSFTQLVVSNSLTLLAALRGND